MASPTEIELYQNKSFDELLQELKGLLFKASKTIPLLFEKGRRAGMQDDEIRLRITGELGVKYRTMLQYIPEDAKQHQEHVKSRTKNVTNGTKAAESATFSEPNIPPREENIIEPEPEIEVPNRPMAAADDLIDSDGIMHVGTEHDIIPLTNKTVRIVMSGNKFNGLGKAMIAMVKEHGLQIRYAIEYDPAEKELYIDLAEKKEETNVKD